MRLIVGGNYGWCHVVVVVFMGSGGAKRWGKALKSSFGVTMQTIRRDNFYGKEGSHHVIRLY